MDGRWRSIMATALHFIIIDYLEVLKCPCKHFFALAVAMQVLQLRMKPWKLTIW
jgi:hypothetical protein